MTLENRFRWIFSSSNYNHNLLPKKQKHKEEQQEETNDKKSPTIYGWLLEVDKFAKFINISVGKVLHEQMEFKSKNYMDDKQIKNECKFF